MNLNHIHIGTNDLAKSREFYENHFGFRKKFDHGKGVFLENDAGFLIAIDPVDNVPKLPDWFHFGFCLDSGAKVKNVYESMKENGIRFAKEYQEYGGDAASFFCLDPDGYKLEVSWHRE